MTVNQSDIIGNRKNEIYTLCPRAVARKYLFYYIAARLNVVVRTVWTG